MNIAFFYIKEKIASTVYDHIEAFHKYSVHNIYYFDILEEQISLEEINKFDAIIIHYTISIFNDDRCPAWLRVLLRHAHAKKIVFIQDEYRRVNDVIENLEYIKADILFTCIPDNEAEKVYPTLKLPHLKKIKTLTGFAPKNLLNYPKVPYHDRLVDVSYRARKLPAWYGRLTKEKWMIAEKFSKDAQKYSLKTDISCEEKDRIYGKDWVRFLQNSKAVLGTESGASVFDFTGEIQKNVEAYEQAYPNASFEEMEQKFFKGLDGNIKLHEISPRCFECAALGTLMILYEGNYSGILRPWRHYIPLKKDHSNMEEIVGYLHDVKKWETITRQAYEEVALNPEYSYQNFIKNFDAHLKDFFENVSLSLENQLLLPLPFPKLSEFVFKEQRISLIRKIMIQFILSILRFFPKSLRASLELKLRLIKQRMILSINTLRDTLKNRDFYYAHLFWKKSLCDEYKEIFLIKRYILSVKKVLGVSPLSILSVDQNNIEFSLSPDSFNIPITNGDALYKAKNIKFVIANSWGIPQEIREKKQTLDYRKLLKHILDL